MKGVYLFRLTVQRVFPQARGLHQNARRYVKSALGAGLPRQFEGRLEEFAPFGRNSKGKASIPYNLEIVYYGPYNLVVASAHGTPSPAGSVNHLETGNVMECTVSPAEIVT